MTHRRGRCDHGGRDRNDVATSQGMPAATRTGKTRNELSPSASGGSKDMTTPWFEFSDTGLGPLTFRIVREYISIILNYKVCGNLL